MKKINTITISAILAFTLSHSPLAAQGWAVGGGIGIPVMTSEYYKEANMGFGLLVQTPYSFAVGPMNMGVGLFAGMASGKTYAGKEESWVEVWPSVNMALNDLAELPVPVGLHAGFGMLPTGMGVTAGASAIVTAQPVPVSVGVNMTLPLAEPKDSNFGSAAHIVRVYVAATYPLPN